jgi:hypothetical protein
MPKFSLPKPINDTQRRFADLCDKGGGTKGGPARTQVQRLLRESGKNLNAIAEKEVAEHFAALPDINPWHLCFAIGLSWGHLAVLDIAFAEVATRLLADWNDADLKLARKFHHERGPDPIEASLRGAYQLFEKVILPKELPTTLERLGRAQERWMSPISHPATRPKYINTWNATAMFMVALFANPSLGDQLITSAVSLPTGGPIDQALGLLHSTHFLSRAPAGKALNDGDFESGAVYENNALFVDVLQGLDDWDLIDVHSGLYMLGTRLPASDHWFVPGSFGTR